jgi:hypothetical protein
MNCHEGRRVMTMRRSAKALPRSICSGRAVRPVRTSTPSANSICMTPSTCCRSTPYATAWLPR